ncbi:heat shock 70 kDa protein 17-like [Glycine soja]|uniref:Heat shock 70 kDa protein 17 n=1 Tax=Glycine soja TaxID=3848 RepID=A0A445F1F3_GLYSO|nr:heat shock 70 kDa protein 17-like [Glycine soja]RZB42685.1 Heat shock 70 kDa protein 17 [Glycine soja]
MASLKVALLALFSVALMFSPSQSAVFSVDLGSESVKVAVVNLKPGQSPICVAINEMSKRKSPALVSFHDGDRLLGEEAAGLAARYPQKVYSQMRDLIAKPYASGQRILNSMYLPFQTKEDSRGGVSFQSENDDAVYSPEELVAMVLGYAANLAEFHAKIPIKDAVIAVPPHMGQAERRGLLAAAQLAGIKVLSLINEHSGAALQYGIDKDFSNESRHVIFYDMGASSSYAALVYFSAYKGKEYEKSVSVNQFQVKDVRWNPELGGQHMELRLVEYFADQFNAHVGGGIDVRKFPKAMAKLKKQVKRTKEILSANTAAPISVESLLDDVDFRSTITREKFEELCEDIWEKSLLPVKEVLEHSGLSLEQIYAVELIGGATRVPKLQAKLQEFLGRKELDRHLDADEAIVLGAALHAANLSDGIKLNRKLGMVDGSLYGFVVELNGPDLLKDESSRQILVPRMKKVPSKMFRSVNHNKDFEVSLAYESDNYLPPGVTSPEIAQYQISGLTDASQKYSSRNLSSPIKANIHFSLSRSGILSLDRADAVIEITEWVEVPRKNLTIENSTISSNVSAESAAGNSTEENNESVQTDSGVNKASNISAEEQAATEPATEKKLKRQTFRVPLKIVEKITGFGMSLSQDFLAEAKRKLQVLDQKDADRKRTAELKNNLEGYIYTTKEKIETLEEFEKVSTSEERQSFIEKLDQVQDWLYTDGEDANATEFQEHLDQLKAVGDPIFFRLKELTTRPAAVEHAHKYIDELKQIVQEWKAKKPWLPQERVDEVIKSSEKLKNWLDEKEAEQKKTSGFSKPAFTSEEVYLKVLDLQTKVASINRIPKPKPKVQKPVKNETESSSAQNTETSDSNSADSSSSSDSSANSSEGTSKETVTEQSEGHDEL